MQPNRGMVLLIMGAHGTFRGGYRVPDAMLRASCETIEQSPSHEKSQGRPTGLPTVTRQTIFHIVRRVSPQ